MRRGRRCGLLSPLASWLWEEECVLQHPCVGCECILSRSPPHTSCLTCFLGRGRIMRSLALSCTNGLAHWVMPLNSSTGRVETTPALPPVLLPAQPGACCAVSAERRRTAVSCPLLWKHTPQGSHGRQGLLAACVSAWYHRHCPCCAHVVCPAAAQVLLRVQARCAHASGIHG